MSTRCVIKFTECFDNKKVVVATVYRHCDGYPGGMDRDLERFFQDVIKASPHDTRFGDPCFLAARFIAWQIMEYAQSSYGSKGVLTMAGALKVTGVGVLGNGKDDEPGDIEYRWFVDCSTGDTPKITHESVR